VAKDQPSRGEGEGEGWSFVLVKGMEIGMEIGMLTVCLDSAKVAIMIRKFKK